MARRRRLNRIVHENMCSWQTRKLKRSQSFDYYYYYSQCCVCAAHDHITSHGRTHVTVCRSFFVWMTLMDARVMNWNAVTRAHMIFSISAVRHFGIFFSSLLAFSVDTFNAFGMMKCVAIAIYRLNRQLQKFLRTFQLWHFFSCFSNGFAAVVMLPNGTDRSKISSFGFIVSIRCLVLSFFLGRG